LQVLNRHYRRHLDVGVQPEEETLGDTRDLGTICYVHDEMTGALAALSIEVRGLWFEILGKLLKTGAIRPLGVSEGLLGGDACRANA